jgi:hypothetical protein
MCRLIWTNIADLAVGTMLDVDVRVSESSL